METFIVAELSANHNQDLELAKKSIEAISKTGANAVKLQTYTPNCLTLESKNEYFKINSSLWKGEYLWDLYERTRMPLEWHEELFNLARKLELICFSSPFSVEGVELLEKLNCPIYKVASFEVMHFKMLEEIAKTKKEVIISLGVATENEIKKALDILKNNKKTLLYCSSNYPSNFNDLNLNKIKKLKKKWSKYTKEDINIGLSDHTPTSLAPIVAVSMGATMIEKHFILDKSLDSADVAFSLDFHEFKDMVNNIRNTELMLKKSSKVIKGRELARSLFVSQDVKKGDIITLDNIVCVRPNKGLSPLFLESILNKTFSMNIDAFTPLKESHIDNFYLKN